MSEKYYSLEYICRICMNSGEKLKSIFKLTFPANKKLPMIDFIRKLTSLKIIKGDGLPETICDTCIKSVTNAFNFINLCIESDEKLNNIKEKIESEITEDDLNSAEIVNKELVVLEELECKICKEKFTHKKDLDNHQKVHTETKTYKCKECLKTFNKYAQLSSHMRTHVKPDEKDFECHICERKFMYSYLLKQHSLKHTDVKPFPCPECKKGCSTRECLKRHMIVHDDNYVKRKHICDICKKEFPYPSFLAEHMKNHTGERPFLCSVCGKGFRQSGALAYHLRSHTGTKSFKCDLCNNYFTSAGTLKVHMRRHTNERPYVCDICGMAFRQSTDMKSHRRIHMGDKRVLCFVCGKKLSTTGQLTVHMRTHTGEKPYKCSTCTKGFSTKTMLVKHTRIHTGERPYVCNICNKSFNQRSTLKTHCNIHKIKEVNDSSQEKISVDDFVESNCILVDQENGTEYSIDTMKSDLQKGEINVVVLPTPVPLIQHL